MSTGKESEILLKLQPDLLTERELIQKIQSRCCRLDNLESMSKEGLVGLFRRVILPLPQRSYRSNRRGQMLTSRRAKTGKGGLDSRRKDEGSAALQTGSRGSSHGSDRLKPPPDISKPHKIRIGSEGTQEKNRSTITQLDSKGRRDADDEEQKDLKIFRPDFTPGRKITLKRPSCDEKSSQRTTTSTENKKQRTAIKWP